MTIDVIFIISTHASLEKHEYFKRYRFICMYPSIKVGDIITSLDYGKQKMLVVKVSPKDKSTTYQGIPLKVISINTVNSYKSKEEIINPVTEMDKRNISITLEQAREWYKSGNATLRKLALAAFTEKELEANSYEQIMREISCAVTHSSLIYPTVDKENVMALSKLRNIAHFLNQGWKKESVGTGFFITFNTQHDYAVEGRRYGWVILKHVNVKYSGIIYFKSIDAAMEALRIAYTEGWLNNLE